MTQRMYRPDLYILRFYAVGKNVSTEKSWKRNI